MPATIIGIDCATDPAKTGLACGTFDGSQVQVTQLCLGQRKRSISDTVQAWIPDDQPTLLALDAPLGWPVALADALPGHAAGDPLVTSSERLFRRNTDRIVQERLGKRSLDLGADRIARTAAAALQCIQDLRSATGRPIELAWSPSIREGIWMIEVYPAATLLAHKIPSKGYKGRPATDHRRRLISPLRKFLQLADWDLAVDNVDAFDALICVLAGADFLAGQALEPSDPTTAKKEGWIWFRDPRLS